MNHVVRTEVTRERKSSRQRAVLCSRTQGSEQSVDSSFREARAVWEKYYSLSQIEIGNDNSSMIRLYGK